VNTATAANRATAISDAPRQREYLPATVNTSQPASARFAQSYVFTANDAFVFIFSVGGHLWVVADFSLSERLINRAGIGGRGCWLVVCRLAERSGAGPMIPVCDD
jgi:hypothetical protein